jgi:hypothetical protein
MTSPVARTRLHKAALALVVYLFLGSCVFFWFRIRNHNAGPNDVHLSALLLIELLWPLALLTYVALGMAMSSQASSFEAMWCILPLLSACYLIYATMYFSWNSQEQGFIRRMCLVVVAFVTFALPLLLTM